MASVARRRPRGGLPSHRERSPQPPDEVGGGALGADDAATPAGDEGALRPLPVRRVSLGLPSHPPEASRGEGRTDPGAAPGLPQRGRAREAATQAPPARPPALTGDHVARRREEPGAREGGDGALHHGCDDRLHAPGEGTPAEPCGRPVQLRGGDRLTVGTWSKNEERLRAHRRVALQVRENSIIDRGLQVTLRIYRENILINLAGLPEESFRSLVVARSR